MAREPSIFTPQRPSYYVQTGGMHQNPFGVPREEVIRFILNNPSEIVAQVVFGKYVESSGLVFQSQVVQRMFERGPQPITGNFWQDTDARKWAMQLSRQWETELLPYAIGIDVARQTDWTVITVLDTSSLPAKVVYWKRLNRVPWETIYTDIGRAVAIFGPNALIDSTGMGGDVVLDALESRYYCKEHDRTILLESVCIDERTRNPLGCNPEDYVSLSCVEGYEFGGGTGERKKRLIENLRNAMSVGYRKDNPEFGWLRCPPIAQLEEELTFYTWKDDKLVTDCVMSLALAAWQGLEEIVPDPEFGSVYGD